jgi:hypothetical protein
MLLTYSPERLLAVPGLDLLISQSLQKGDRVLFFPYY